MERLTTANIGEHVKPTPVPKHRIVGGNVKWPNHFERTGVAVSYKSKHAPPFRPSSPTQSYLPRIKENMCLHKDLYPLFIAALFAVVKAWKQPRCPSAGEWIHCSVFIPVSATQQERGVDPWYMHQLAGVSEPSHREEKPSTNSACCMTALHAVWELAHLIFGGRRSEGWWSLGGGVGGELLGRTTKNLRSDSYLFWEGLC